MTTLTHEPNEGCGTCVFFSERGQDRCEAVPERVGWPASGRRVLLETSPAPEWCPLRKGPVVVLPPTVPNCTATHTWAGGLVVQERRWPGGALVMWEEGRAEAPGPTVKVRLAPPWPSDPPWDITYAKPSGAPKEYAAFGPSLYGEDKVTVAYRAARERFPGVALEVVERPDLGEYIVEIRPREGE